MAAKWYNSLDTNSREKALDDFVFLDASCTNLLMVLAENVVLIQFSGRLLAKVNLL